MRRILIFLTLVLILISGCESKIAILKRAAKYRDQERYLEAIKEYNKLISRYATKEPYSVGVAEAYYQIGEIYYFYLKKPEKAVENLVKATKHFPRSRYTEPYVLLGVIFYENNDLPQAEEALTTALLIKPEIVRFELAEDKPLGILLSEIYAKQNKLLDAAHQLFKLTRYGKNPQHWFSLGQIFERLADFKLALLFYEKAFEESDASYRKSLNSFPLRIRLIEMYRRNSWYDKPLALATDSIELLKEIEQEYGQSSKEDIHQFTEMKKYFELYLSKLYYQRGLIHLSKRELDEALKDFDTALEKSPRDAAIISVIIATHTLKKEFSKALEKIHEVQNKNPDDPKISFLLVNLYIEQKKWEEALNQLNAYLEKQPDESTALISKAFVMTQKGEVNEGLSELFSLYKEDPNSSQIQYNIARVYAQQGKDEEAMQWLDKAVKNGFRELVLLQTDEYFDPVKNNINFKNILNKIKNEILLEKASAEAFALVLMGEKERGLQKLLQLAQADPHSINKPYYLARAYALQSNNDDAFQWLDKSVENGLLNTDILERDQYFQELKTDPRFQKLIDRMNQKLSDEFKTIQ